MAVKNTDSGIGHFLSKVLRHRPDIIGIEVERDGGWVDTAELIEKTRALGYDLDMERLERIVRENNKHRYAFSEDKRKIRALQGHSIDVVIEMKEAVPPDLLYHGTSSDFLDSIKAEGIRSMKRNFVHLSKDFDTAVDVASRHTRRSGHIAVLTIDTVKMREDGFVFRISENGVWQSEDIPWRYVKDVAFPEKC